MRLTVFSRELRPHWQGLRVCGTTTSKWLGSTQDQSTSTPLPINAVTEPLTLKYLTPASLRHFCRGLRLATEKASQGTRG